MYKTDILSPSDVKVLIKIFYDKLLHSSIQHHFVNLHLKSHLPLVESFWNSTLFPDKVYTSNLVEKHIHLPFKKEDFNTWLNLFWQSIDEQFVGNNAELIKSRSASIAYIMQKKLLTN